MLGKLYLGCAVWAYKGWVGEFYPPKTQASDYLRLYVERLSAVEGNTTFYAVPSDENMTRWSEAMPEGFRFCPKIYKGYTHMGALMQHWPEVASLRERMTCFGESLGPMMLQLPPSYGPDMMDDLLAFLAKWPVHQTPLAVELRHSSWWLEPHRTTLLDAMTSCDVGRVLLDTRPVYDSDDDPQLHSERRKPSLPLSFEVTSQTVLIRYIGHPTLELNRPYLDAWAEHIAYWLEQDRTVYFFAHCPVEAQSPYIARSIHRILSRKGVEIDPLGWDHVKAFPKQMGLF